jgi:signal transduction histidine kinase
MKVAPLPPIERERISKLESYQILDTPPEEPFDRITRLVSQLIGVPIALVSLVENERQWFKSRQGLAAQETPRDIAFCSHAILQDDLLEISDTLADPRFADNPLVTSEPSIRFYAGAPLNTPDGFKLGTLCVIDRKPKKLSDDERQILTDLACVIVDEMELRIALKLSRQRMAREIESQLLKDEFVSTISHELRTPLTSIRGTLSLLESGRIGALPEKVGNLIGIASRNTDNLIDLVGDLLNIQELERGTVSFDFNTLEPGPLLAEICENLSGLAAEKRISIECEIEKCPAIMGDRMRVGQVLTNLISNAVKFSEDGAAVTARVLVVGNKLKFQISDTGPGIPDDFRESIFDRFSRARSSKNIPGTGLGLAISKAIVDAHDGTIFFQSQVGQGTDFFVEFPLAQSLS